MFPFCCCVCQDHKNWLIVSQDANNAPIGSNVTIKHNVKVNEKCLQIIFPNSSDDNNQYSIPDVAKVSVVPSLPKLSIASKPLQSLHKIMDGFNYQHDPLHNHLTTYLPINQENDGECQLSKEDIQLLNQVNHLFDKRRLIKIQKSKKFSRRRQSINFYQNIRICNPDRFGLVDVANFTLTQKYLAKYLTSWDFNIFRLNRFTGGRSTLVQVGMGLFQNSNLISHFRFDDDILRKFLYSVQSAYHNFNPYHNALHSADVAQSMHCFLSDDKIKAISDPVDILSCIIAALCHDADHPGLNQLYLEKINHFFVSLYNRSSVLENHHIRVTISLLHQSTLLNFVSADDWKVIFSVMCNLILATDITHQKTYLNKFINLHHEKRSSPLSGLTVSVDEKVLIYQMALKCSDISNPTRSWPVSLGWASLVCEEFFLQGDVEKTQGLAVMSIHDRCMSTKADIQLGFIRFIVRPLIAQWNCFVKSTLTSTLVKQVDTNLNNWESFKQRFSAISAKSLQSTSSKTEATNLPLISELATLTEETTLTSSCITRHHALYQRRFSLPDNVARSTKGPLKCVHNASTTIVTFPRPSTASSSCRRGSLPQHPRASSVIVPDVSRRRGSLPLTVRSFPKPTAWEEEPENMSRSTYKPSLDSNEGLRGRRGSAPLVSYPRCGQDCSMLAGSGMIARGCSREQLLLEVYWMTASSSVSSMNSIVPGTSTSNLHLINSVPLSSSSSSSRNDSGASVVAI